MKQIHRIRLKTIVIVLLALSVLAGRPVAATETSTNAAAGSALDSYFAEPKDLPYDEETLAEKQEDGWHWRERQQWISWQILEHLWHPNELIFHDRDTTTGEPTRVKTFFRLLPLWAGVDLPEAEARRAIERHLLNPKEFWGAVPFPSVAYDEPTYDPLGYWRGRAWPHVYFWNAEILSNYGYTREAALAKERYLAVVSGSREIAENYPRQWAKINQAGMPHYSFGTGTLVHFLADWHKEPL